MNAFIYMYLVTLDWRLASLLTHVTTAVEFWYSGVQNVKTILFRMQIIICSKDQKVCSLIFPLPFNPEQVRFKINVMSSLKL